MKDRTVTVRSITNPPNKLAYPVRNGSRDLRLDFLRGLIMMVVITVHMEYFSLFSIFAWERIGYVSSAEGFVILSGIVLGIVYKKRLLHEGFKSSAIKLWKRSFQLYRVNLFVILSIGWLLIPLGQASLYVFIVHIYLIILVSNISLGEYDSFIVNTMIHAISILLIWAMVKYQVLFQVIPR